MPLLILGVLLAVLIYFPQFWIRRVMAKNSGEITGLPGTGGELAEHLIERFALQGIKVEETVKGGDHFDPKNKVVRLSPANYRGKSLTAIAIAAHEVGHAIQFSRQETIFELRKKYIPRAALFNRAGVAIMWSLPVIGMLARSPVLIGILVGASLLMQLLGAMAYLIILPEEWDASFNKALPILIEGEYIDENQVPRVRQILKAAALTYFAGALAQVLNIGRWFMVLRR